MFERKSKTHVAIINWFAIASSPIWAGFYMLGIFVYDCATNPDGDARRVLRGEGYFWN